MGDEQRAAERLMLQLCCCRQQKEQRAAESFGCCSCAAAGQQKEQRAASMAARLRHGLSEECNTFLRGECLAVQRCRMDASPVAAVCPASP